MRFRFTMKRLFISWVLLYCIFLVFFGFLKGSIFSSLMKTQTRDLIRIVSLTVENIFLQAKSDVQQALDAWVWNRNGELLFSKTKQPTSSSMANFEEVLRKLSDEELFLSEFRSSVYDSGAFLYAASWENETLRLAGFSAETWIGLLQALMDEEWKGFIVDENDNGFYFDHGQIKDIDFLNKSIVQQYTSYLLRYENRYYFLYEERLSGLTFIYLRSVRSTVFGVFLTAMLPFFMGVFLILFVGVFLRKKISLENGVLDTYCEELKKGRIVTPITAETVTAQKMNTFTIAINEILEQNSVCEKEIDRLTKKSAQLSETIRINFQNVTSVNRLLQKFAFSEDYNIQRAIEAVAEVLIKDDQMIAQCNIFFGKECVFKKAGEELSEEGAEKIVVEQGDSRILLLLKPGKDCSERDFLLKQEVFITFFYTTLILFLLRQETQLDPFTGLYRFEHFSKLAQIELDKNKRYGHKGSIVLTNLKNFRLINERFGLNTSNQFISTVAKIIKYNIRKGDIAGRFSGDRFLIFFQENSKAEAAKKMDGLRELINKALPYEETFNLWSFEYGVAECTNGSKNITELITEAANAMFAQRAGN